MLAFASIAWSILCILFFASFTDFSISSANKRRILIFSIMYDCCEIGVPSAQLAKRVQSEPGGFQLTVVPNNPFGVDVNKPTTTLSVADGYWALLKATSLRPGKHTITFDGEADFPELDFTFRTEVTYKIVEVTEVITTR